MKVSYDRYLGEIVPMMARNIFQDIDFKISPTGGDWHKSIVMGKYRGVGVNDPETQKHYLLSEVKTDFLTDGVYGKAHVVELRRYPHDPQFDYDGMSPEIVLMADVIRKAIRSGVPKGHRHPSYRQQMREIQHGLCLAADSEELRVIV